MRVLNIASCSAFAVLFAAPAFAEANPTPAPGPNPTPTAETCMYAGKEYTAGAILCVTSSLSIICAAKGTSLQDMALPRPAVTSEITAGKADLFYWVYSKSDECASFSPPK